MSRKGIFVQYEGMAPTLIGAFFMNLNDNSIKRFTGLGRRGYTGLCGQLSLWCKRMSHDHWVNIESELPKLPPPFIEDGRRVTPITSRCLVYDGESVYEKSFDKDGFDDEFITHWQYLPEPPIK